MSSTTFTTIPRIPPFVPLALLVVGFVIVLIGIDVLQVVGTILVVVAITIPVFGPTKRVEEREPEDQIEGASDGRDDASEGGLESNGHLHVSSGARLTALGASRDAETSRRRARKKREESAGAPGR